MPLHIFHFLSWLITEWMPNLSLLKSREINLMRFLREGILLLCGLLKVDCL